MNLKYYLRGLGIGVVVTALIMGIATGSSRQTLSNDEIKERAKALGMIEETTLLSDAVASAEPLAEPVVEPTAEPTAAATPEPTAAATLEPTTKPTAEPTPEPAAKSTLEPTAKPTSEPTQEPTQEESSSLMGADSIIIEVRSGEGSYTVCEKLETAGLIASASDFDSYLGQNGYDRRIRAGEHEIPANAEPKEIAQILAGEK